MFSFSVLRHSKWAFISNKLAGEYAGLPVVHHALILGPSRGHIRKLQSAILESRTSGQVIAGRESWASLPIRTAELFRVPDPSHGGAQAAEGSP
jgi:hypothetical protein